MGVYGLAAIGLVLIAAGVVSAHDDQRWEHQEKVPLFVDNLIPENNPSESYRYFSLKFCKPAGELKYKSQTLGEVLGGSRKIYSKYDLPFGADIPHEVLCQEKLTAEDVDEFREAIRRQFHFTMYYDEIPLRGYVGEKEDNGDMYLYTTHIFTMESNRDRIIDAHIAPDKTRRVKLEAGKPIEVTFSYSASWKTTDTSFEDRRANNAGEFYESVVVIQWFSIINSIVLTVLISGFLIFIVLRVLRKDYQRYSKLGEEEDQEESGWKRLHADVFRFPKHRALFCSILGCGVQMMLIFVCMLTLAVVGVFYPHGRGTAYAAVVVIYSLTAVISGYVSGSMYRKLNGSVWVHNVLCTVTLVVLPLFVVWAFLNTVAIAYGSTAALPFGTIVALFALYFLVTFPLTLAGAIAGKNYAGDFDAPTRTKFQPREIPEPPIYGRQSVQIAIAGFLPFSAIFVELYYVFLSIWGHHNFMPFGILYLVFVILCVITACISASLTYLQLSTEDHRWWWNSIFTGGATSLYVLLYCFYYLVTESEMTGFLQLSFYFGYMSILCFALFLMGGAIGFFSSLTFVKEIYRTIKSD